jgi:hypothetical protein
VSTTSVFFQTERVSLDAICRMYGPTRLPLVQSCGDVRTGDEHKCLGVTVKWHGWSAIQP